jgi:3-hydroxymyristoyl/3-hydroxydecanoyl-(acyl carrier protein) dehydratase
VPNAAAALAKATTTFCIAVDHPALPGHFPGAPVVPGVLLLAEGLQRLGALTPVPIQCQHIESAKFLQPVAPGTAITATLTIADSGQQNVEFFVAGKRVAQLTFISHATDRRVSDG